MRPPKIATVFEDPPGAVQVAVVPGDAQLRLHDLLVVHGPSVEIRDPDTGDVLGTRPVVRFKLEVVYTRHPKYVVCEIVHTRNVAESPFTMKPGTCLTHWSNSESGH